MLNLERRNYPMQVSIIATAKVHDLIGLVCWKCTIEYPDCTLKYIHFYFYVPKFIYYNQIIK